MSVRRDKHSGFYGDNLVVDNVFVDGELVSSRVRGEEPVAMKVREIGVDGKAGPERVVAPAPAKGVDQAAPARRAHATSTPRWQGCIPASFFATALIILIPVFALTLTMLSMLGTFYGARGLDVPILAPWQVYADAQAAPWVFGMAVVAQVVLSVAQYGCPELAYGDRRWWAGYVLALGLSIWWNWIGYAPVLTSLGVPWLIAFGIVVLGDVVPEIAAKRR